MLIHACRAHSKSRNVVLIIGAAASRSSTAARAELPQLPWSDIIGMRHRLR
jgi:uncharacterized protein with HEPN domain